jgi:osmotically inducible protein OsmC
MTCSDLVLAAYYEPNKKNSMPARKANAAWEGDLRSGKGRMTFGSGAFDGAYSFSSRFEEGTGTNPEELIAAAHAGCFSMALSGILTEAGFTPTRIETAAKVFIERAEKGFSITRIELTTEGDIPGIDEETFRKHAETAKVGCPVSKALTGTSISLEARLKQ